MRALKIELLCMVLLYGGSRITSVNSNVLKDIGKSAVDTATGVLGKIPDVVPSPEGIFQSAKNIIAGYPLDIAASAINTFCKFLLDLYVLLFRIRMWVKFLFGKNKQKNTNFWVQSLGALYWQLSHRIFVAVVATDNCFAFLSADQ